MEVLSKLSPTEAENIRLIAQGKIQKEVADIRCVAFTTVRKQVRVAIEKTGVSSLYELVARYAQANPNLFKNAIASMFIVIQIGMIAQTHKIERTYKRAKTRTHRVARRNLV